MDKKDWPVITSRVDLPSLHHESKSVLVTVSIPSEATYDQAEKILADFEADEKIEYIRRDWSPTGQYYTQRLDRLCLVKAEGYDHHTYIHTITIDV